MSNNENFKVTLIRQYSDVIEEIILESESVYRSCLDLEELDWRVKGMIQAAKVDGLEEKIIWDLLERRVPDYYQMVKGGSMKSSKIAA